MYSHTHIHMYGVTIMCICVYIYIYIYIYIVSGCQCQGFYLQHLWAVSDCLEGLPLSILARRPHKELDPCERVRPEVRGKKDEGRWTPAVRESDRQRRVSGESEGSMGSVKTMASQKTDVEWWRQWPEMNHYFWKLLEVSQCTCDSQKKAIDHFLTFCCR